MCSLAGNGERSAQALLDGAREAMRPFDVQPEYVTLVDPDTFEPLDELDELDGDALLALAARIGEVRLIDNTMLSPASTQRPEGEAIATCSA